VHESLGIIFYPLLMGVFLLEGDRLFSSQKFALIAFILVSMLSFTHHLTMYMLVLQSVLVLAFSFIMSRKVSFHQTRMFLYAIISLSMWQLYNASYVIYIHGKIPIDIVQALFLEHSSQATTVAPDSMSLLQRSSVYLGFGLLVAVSLLGILQAFKKGGKDYLANTNKWSMRAWWTINAGMMALFVMVPWGAIDPAVRYRDLEFVYFGVALFCAVGACILLDWGKKVPWRLNSRLKERLTEVVVLLSLFAIAVPTILIGFRYYVYDNPGTPVSDYSYPIESYYSASWLATNTVFDRVVGSSGGRDLISVPASVEFDYTSFVNSVRTHVLLNSLYWINTANLLYPDESNFKLSSEDEHWLDSNSNAVYDNGAIEMLIPAGSH
jgi:hypothetical protein